jgi:hypothetical protein
MERRQILLHRCISLVGCVVLLSFVITWIIAVAARNAICLMFHGPNIGTLGDFRVRFSCLPWIICFAGLALMYGFEGYLNRHIEISQSCFFMSCAPQPIPEEDQKAACLRVFLFLLCGS